VDCREIWQTYVNLRSFLLEMGVNMTQSAAFLAAQNKWTRDMIEDHPRGEDDYWRHVSYIVAQFDGLYDGYRAAASSDWAS